MTNSSWKTGHLEAAPESRGWLVTELGAEPGPGLLPTCGWQARGLEQICGLWVCFGQHIVFFREPKKVANT